MSRQMRWSLALALAVAVVALAGCGGKDTGANQVRLGDGQRISLDLPEEQQPDPEDIRGAVSGIVVNEGIFPLAGATVMVQDRDLDRVSDADGKFVFENMAPGLYTLEVHMEGYREGLGTINVKSGQVVKSILQVHRLPVLDPYHTTHKVEVLYDSSQSFLFGSDEEAVVAFDLPPATVVLEAFWTGLVSPTDNLRYNVQAESDPEAFQTGSVPNPLRVALGSDFFPRDEYAIRFSVYPSMATLPPESRGDIFLTIFYVDPAPDGWSLADGDT